MQLRGIVVPILLLAVGLAATVPHARAAGEYAVSGHVLSDVGKPIEGALVNGNSYSSDVSSQADVKTGADGSYTLHLPAGKATISVSYAAWNAYDSSSFLLDGDKANVDFKLQTPPPKDATIEGRILDESGKPISGATVTLGNACCIYYGKPAEAPTTNATTPPPAPESPASSGNAGSATIARPCCYNGDNEAPIVTGDDGAYKFATTAGTHEIAAQAKGYAQTRVSVEAVAHGTVKQDLALPKVPASSAHVHGRILDTATGAPVGGAQVGWNSLQWGRGNFTTTSADGAYDFWTLPGWGQLNVYANRYDYAIMDPAAGAADGKPIAPGMPIQPARSYYPWIDTVKLAAGETGLDIKIDAKPQPTIVLTGYAVDPDAKKGVAGAQVSVWNADTGESGSATTDKTGSFKILVAPGHYTMNAWAPDHLGGAATFVVPNGALAQRQDVKLPAGTPTYVPCDDCPAPMMEGDKTMSASTPAGGPAARGPQSLTATGGNGTTTGQSATYAGSGGGLPEYAADSASTQKPVPAAPVGVMLLALAAIGIVLRRR